MSRRRSNRDDRRTARRRHRRRGDRAPGRIWSWLGLGALAAVGVWALRGPRDGSARRRGLEPDRDDAAAADRPRPYAVANREDGVAGDTDAAIESGWVSGPAGTIHVLERNREAAFGVVLVHGLGGTAEHWRGTLEALGPAIRGLALDLPGHGASDPPTTAFDLDDLAASVAAAMAGVGLRNAVVVGHSVGGLVALRLARKVPGQVAGLLLLDPPGDPASLPAAESDAWLEAIREAPHETLVDGFRQILLGSDEAVAARVLDDLRGCDAETLYQAYRAASSAAPLEDLDACRVPTRILVTSLNEQAASLHRLRPQIEAESLGAAGHWAMLDDPSTFLRALDAFFDRVRAQPS